MEARQPHILDGYGFVELDKYGSKLVEQIMPNPAGVVVFKEPFQAFMPKADDHDSL
jgi:hypothetical protein